MAFAALSISSAIEFKLEPALPVTGFVNCFRKQKQKILSIMIYQPCQKLQTLALIILYFLRSTLLRVAVNNSCTMVCLSVREIINRQKLKLVYYLLLQVERPWYNCYSRNWYNHSITRPVCLQDSSSNSAFAHHMKNFDV